MSPKINKTVLLSGAEYFDTGQAINPFMDAARPVDRTTAATEHRHIREALEQAGVQTIQVAAPQDCQDGVYTANWALVRGDTAVMARLPNARKAEEAYAEAALRNLGKKIIKIPENFRFSGQGDALPCGNFLFCGSTYRSDVEAQEFAAATLGYERIQLRTVPLLDKQGNEVTNSHSGWADSFYYDIDLALSILKFPQKKCTHDAQALSAGAISFRGADRSVSQYGEESTGEKNHASAKEARQVTGSAGEQAGCPECRGLIAWCPEAFTPESQQILRDLDTIDKIEVSEAEAKQAFACNLVSTGTHVIMNAGATQFAKDIAAQGLQPILLSNPELGKGGGSIRCITLTIDN